MSFPSPAVFPSAVCLGVGCLLLASLPAKAATNPSASLPPSLATAGSDQSPESLKSPPSPPVPQPPISFFRDLLAMSPAERDRALTNRPPQIRRMILAKVQEYESLDPAERELRLRVTELRWYLRPLMAASATNRPAQLAAIPEEQRKLVEVRLKAWDKLPPEVQKVFLENEDTLSWFSEIQGRSNEQRRDILDTLSPERRRVLEQGISRWAAMSDGQRQATLDRFKQFFELTQEEKDKAIKPLPEPEREQVERTLRMFGSLSPEQREQCMSSFAKYTSLSLAERQEFWRNVERWKQMTPAEQEAWRELVKRLPPRPPLPPPRPPLPPRRPPLPPSLESGPPVPAVVTNGRVP
jgi:hypothetical protein